MEIEDLKKELKKYLKDDEKRYLHSIGVMKMSQELAKKYGADIERAGKAGLMHDMAKRMSKEEKRQYVEENNIEASDLEKNMVEILHGKIAADICKKKYDFDDEMCDAIANHTTGKENMTLLQKIIFVADKIDETRTYSDVEYYRNLAREDLDKAILEIINYVIKDKIESDKPILEQSIKTRNYILLENEK